MADAGYIVTRKPGAKSVLVSRLAASATNPATGERTQSRSTIAVRNVVIEPTTYRRRAAAREAAEEIGETTLLFYTRDVPFRKLNPTDCVIEGERRLQVVTSTVEETVLRVTANEQAGQA